MRSHQKALSKGDLTRFQKSPSEGESDRQIGTGECGKWKIRIEDTAVVQESIIKPRTRTIAMVMERSRCGRW